MCVTVHDCFHGDRWQLFRGPHTHTPTVKRQCGGGACRDGGGVARFPGYNECCAAVGAAVRCWWEPDGVGVVLWPLQPS